VVEMAFKKQKPPIETMSLHDLRKELADLKKLPPPVAGAGLAMPEIADRRRELLSQMLSDEIARREAVAKKKRFPKIRKLLGRLGRLRRK